METLRNELIKFLDDSIGENLLIKDKEHAIIVADEYLHRKQVKNCNIPHVSKQRELLIAYHKWLNNEYFLEIEADYIVDNYLDAINSC